MNLLLDTNVLLWWLTGNARLSAKIHRAISEADGVYVSAISVWEIEIKKSRRNLEAPDDLEDVLPARGLRPLNVTLAHAVTAGRLPPHHSDPFDRMLVAQAINEQLTLVTADRILANYEAETLIT